MRNTHHEIRSPSTMTISTTSLPSLSQPNAKKRGKKALNLPDLSPG